MAPAGGRRDWQTAARLLTFYAEELWPLAWPADWDRAWMDDPTAFRFAGDRFVAGLAAVAEAARQDRRMTREAAVEIGRRMPADWSLAASSCSREMFGLFCLAAADAGLRRLPRLAGRSLIVLPILDDDGSVGDLIGWPEGEPEDWRTRTNLYGVLKGRRFGPGLGAEPDRAAGLGGGGREVGQRVRLCATPEAWWREGGEASAAVCLLDATSFEGTTIVEGAEALVCDSEAHAAAVQAWLKARRPRLPKLWVAA